MHNNIIYIIMIIGQISLTEVLKRYVRMHSFSSDNLTNEVELNRLSDVVLGH